MTYENDYEINDKHKSSVKNREAVRVGDIVK
jgi:hypothetical protein